MLVCPEDLRFGIEDGIPDLYLPICTCGHVLTPVREDSYVWLACSQCGREVKVFDAFKERQPSLARELYVARKKDSVLEEWEGAIPRYWTIPIVVSEKLRREVFNYIRGKRILDMGTGPGIWLHYVAQSLRKRIVLIACDISMRMLKAARRGLQDPDWLAGQMDFSLDLPPLSLENQPPVLFIRADAERPPFRDDTMDTCISFQTLQYTNPRTSIAQLLRVTRPGGRVVVGMQPGSERCGYLEYDSDPAGVKNPARREALLRQFRAFDSFIAWFSDRYPREARLFREGWKTYGDHPLDVFLKRERGEISDEEFSSWMTRWEEEVGKPLDPTKHSCCYGERRFVRMLEETARESWGKVLEAGTRSMPLEDAVRFDPDTARRIDLDDSWDRGMYLHLYGVRFAVLERSLEGETGS